LVQPAAAQIIPHRGAFHGTGQRLHPLHDFLKSFSFRHSALLLS
jgi:hypothetical protein